MDEFGLEKPRITKLTGTNYRPWSIQVRTLLRGLGLWDVVEDGLKSTIAKRATEKPGVLEGLKLPDLVTKDAKASSLIMGLCSREALDHILLCESASAQWDALESLYRPLGLQQLGTKIRAFNSYKAPEGKGVTEVANHLSTLQAEIGAIDPKEKPSETVKRAHLYRLAGELDQRFEPLILQLEMRETLLDFETTVAKLAEWERRLGPKEGVKEGALSAQTPKGKGKKDKAKKPKGACFKCGQEGHFKADCPEEGDKKPSTGPLATPSGGKGLSPKQTQANIAEISWMATAATGQSVPRYSSQEPVWIVDSGCSRHMTYAKWKFEDYTKLDEPIGVTTASGAVIQAVGQGTVRIKTLVQGQIRPVRLLDVLHVPGLAGSLISVLQLQNKDLTIETTTGAKRELLIKFQGATVGVAYRVGQAYVLQGPMEGAGALKATVKESNSPEAMKWHRRLGHLSPGSIKDLHKVTTGLKEPIRGLKKPCEVCITSKSARVLNRKPAEHSTKPLERVFSDFWGPYSTPGLAGEAYMLTFTDDYTRKSWVFFTKERKELRDVFQVFRARVEAETSLKLKKLRCDNAPEYRALEKALAATGLQFEFTTPYTPEQNEVSERLNRSLMTVARSMLQDAQLPTKFWAEAANTACYLRNRTPIGPEGITPEEAYSGRKPYVGHLRAFGCVAYAHAPKERRQKLDPNAKKMVFIGYMPTARQYRLYDPAANKVVLATAPVFNENKHIRLAEPNATPEPEVQVEPELPEGDTIVVDTSHLYAPGSPEIARQEGPELGGINDSDSSELGELSDQEDPEAPEFRGNSATDSTETQGAQGTQGAQETQSPELRRSSRPRAPINYALSATTKVNLPRNYTEAINDSVWGAYWKEAIKDELTKLQALGTWEYAILPEGKKPVGTKWVFAVKYTPTGLIDRFKARLVAQGFSQVPGDDFLETFSPTVRQESLRVLLAIGAYEDLEIKQVDVVSAYPRAKLHATIYAKVPLGLEGCPEGRVLSLKRPLYGLKQSGREWYIEACSGFKKLGFQPLYSDPSVFRNPESGMLIGLYVDDMLILGPVLREVQEVIKGISGLWQIKDLGNVGVILGLQVTRDREAKTLKLTQGAYIKDLIARFKLEAAKPISLPVADRNGLTKGEANEPQADQALYQSAIGGLLWCAKGTRPDITYVVGQLSQHCSEPKVRHWNAVLRVLRYLKDTQGYGLQYGHIGSQEPGLQGYCDADYAGDTTDRRSVSGYLYLLLGGPVTWNSVKQRCVSLSTTEAEYIALSEASKQGQWLRALIREVDRPQYLGSHLEVPMLSDNQGCIALAKDPIAHSRTKHIEVRYHYIRDLIAYGKATIKYCPTEDMLADVLTKPLPLVAFKRCTQGLMSLK
ncbi:hypothetical protein ACMFMG_012223 [Clarireedia jacksonii]